jgi:hypothetical protein
VAEVGPKTLLNGSGSIFWAAPKEFKIPQKYSHVYLNCPMLSDAFWKLLKIYIEGRLFCIERGLRGAPRLVGRPVVPIV